ncbi:MAG: transporter substrate-binding domain-containing protein [Rhodocyclaceae bacterium]|nr:transporter substrate-binding domain-containing protein [Rhodocyclaceae bacterium]
MRLRRWICTGIVVLLVAGCAGIQKGVSTETRAALAPKGKLRVAFLSAPIYVSKDAATGELRGVAVDLGKDLARRASVLFDPVVYASFPELMNGAKSGQWDVALMGVDAQRATVVDFSAPFMNVEQGYLVRAGVQIAAASDVDVPGVRVGVLEKSSLDILLSQTLKNAAIVRARTLAENYALLDAGKTDVMAATKPALFAGAVSRPGAQVLDGRFPVDAIGIGIPKGRDAAAAAYIVKFVEEAKAEGLVKSAIERAGLLGVVVAPLK